MEAEGILDMPRDIADRFLELAEIVLDALDEVVDQLLAPGRGPLPNGVTEVAERIANSIGPAFEGFAAVAGTLPFDLEPATYIVIQPAATLANKKAAQ